MAETPTTEEHQAFERAASEELAELEDPSGGSETSKFKQLFAVLKKTVGVKDLASLRLSLPANLLHPEGNLEYWHCEADFHQGPIPLLSHSGTDLDRPDFFAAIADNDNSLERMLAVLRWMFTKDLKVAKGKVCKPYNSVLGEQFRAIWDVYPATLDPKTSRPIVQHGIDTTGPASVPLPATPISTSSSASSIKSETVSPLIGASSSTAGSSSSSLVSAMSRLTTTATESTPATSVDQGPDRPPSTALPKHPGKARVVFLNEQCSHHPPVSTFWYESQPPDEGPSQRVVAYGVDQLSAKFTGASVRVFAGEQNFGIYVKLPGRNDEEYRITHPTANVTGFLRGSPYVTVSEYSYVTCLAPNGNSTEGTKALRAIVAFVDESWIGKARFALEAVVYEYTIGSEAANYTKIKQVPESAIKGYVEGSWRGKITWKTSKTAKPITLIDLGELLPLPKTVRPMHVQHELESRRLWHPVTSSILSKQFSQATKHKQTIEQKQRDLAAERARSDLEHEVLFFDDAVRFEAGRPKLSSRGRKVVDSELAGLEYDPLDIPSDLLSQMSLAA